MSSLLASKIEPCPYEDYVNSQWVKLLDVLGMNVRYCVHDIGHDHPAVIEALKRELDRNGPAMLQSQCPIWLAILLSGSAGEPLAS
jgi:ornithine--oxo-acid transaminase